MFRTDACPSAGLVRALAFLLLLSWAPPGEAQEPTTFVSAARRYEDRDLEGAREAYAELVKTNPYRGEFWYRKGVTEFFTGRYEDAVASLTRCVELGHDVKFATYVLGRSHLALGDPSRAAASFARVVELDPSWLRTLREDEDLAEFNASSSAAEVYGVREATASTGPEAWISDLDFLYRVLRRSHYDLFGKTDERRWNVEIEALRDRLPEMSPDERYLAFMRFVALAGDAHTNIWPVPSDRFEFHMLPVSLYLFSEGLYVRGGAEAASATVGGRVVRIGGRPWEELFDALEPYVGHENLMHRRLTAPILLSIVEILIDLRAARPGSAVELTLELPDGSIEDVAVDPIPLDYSAADGDGFRPGWTYMNAGARRSPPLRLRNPGAPYWFESITEKGIVYVQYDAVRDDENLEFEVFLQRVFDAVDRPGVRALVLDIRSNEGGSTPEYEPLLERLIARESYGRLPRVFTIIGRKTFSAAMNLAVDLEHWIDPIFVGEPTGQAPNFIGENQFFELPRTGIPVSVSDRYHQRGASDSTDRRIWIAPHVAAEPSASQYSENVDPAFEAILAFLDSEARPETPPPSPTTDGPVTDGD